MGLISRLLGADRPTKGAVEEGARHACPYLCTHAYQRTHIKLYAWPALPCLALPGLAWPCLALPCLALPDLPGPAWPGLAYMRC